MLICFKPFLVGCNTQLPTLSGEWKSCRIRTMWQMRCLAGKGYRIAYLSMLVGCWCAILPHECQVSLRAISQHV